MSEKYLGEVSTPLLINQIKENCAQKRTTLPIASIDELGHIYQYMGATSGSLIHGYFYECVSDGQDPATYSWQQVNTQPTPATPTASGTTFDNTTSGLQATNVQDAIDEVEGRVDTIEGTIPSTATSSNKLVDHDSLGTAAFKDFTPNVAPNNHSLVESNAVYNAITTALTSVYTPRGDLTCAELTSSLLIAANVGNIYEMSDAGTTSNLFLQGAGQTIHVGDNVGIIQTGVSEYKFNLMANAFDMTDYQKKDLTQAVEGETTVEGALGALSTNKADKVSSATNGDIASLDANGNLVDSGITSAIVPSDASASNKLLSYKSTQLYANYQTSNTRVVRIEYPSNLSTRLHLITETGSQLRDVFIQVATRIPFVTVYDMGASSLFTIKTADVSNKRVIYINVGTSDGSVIINQDDVPTDGYGNLLLPTVTVTNTSDEEWTSATDITPIKLRPTSSVTSGSTAPITSGGVYDYLAGTPLIGLVTTTLGRLGFGAQEDNLLVIKTCPSSEITNNPFGNSGNSLFIKMGIVEFVVGAISADPSQWSPNTGVAYRVRFGTVWQSWHILTQN